MHDDLDDRFEQLRKDTMDSPVAEPAALRRVAQRRVRNRAALILSSCATGVATVAALVSCGVGAPQTTPVGGAPTSSTTISGSPSSAGLPPPCQAADFTLSIYGGDGAAGSAFTGLELTNSRETPCQLPGSPVVTWLDGVGQPLPSKMINVLPLPLLIVGPLERIYVTIRTTNVPAGDHEGAPCDPPAAALRLTLPSGGGDLTVAAQFRACQGGSISVLTVATTPDPNMHK